MTSAIAGLHTSLLLSTSCDRLRCPLRVSMGYTWRASLIDLVSWSVRALGLLIVVVPPAGAPKTGRQVRIQDRYCLCLTLFRKPPHNSPLCSRQDTTSSWKDTQHLSAMLVCEHLELVLLSADIVTTSFSDRKKTGQRGKTLSRLSKHASNAFTLPPER
jgi:hypothetical protein